jgi:hypothetical protein
MICAGALLSPRFGPSSNGEVCARVGIEAAHDAQFVARQGKASTEKISPSMLGKIEDADLKLMRAKHGNNKKVLCQRRKTNCKAVTWMATGCCTAMKRGTLIVLTRKEKSPKIHYRILGIHSVATVL